MSSQTVETGTQPQTQTQQNERFIWNDARTVFLLIAVERLWDPFLSELPDSKYPKLTRIFNDECGTDATLSQVKSRVYTISEGYFNFCHLAGPPPHHRESGYVHRPSGRFLGNEVVLSPEDWKLAKKGSLYGYRKFVRAREDNGMIYLSFAYQRHLNTLGTVIRQRALVRDYTLTTTEIDHSRSTSPYAAIFDDLGESSPAAYARSPPQRLTARRPSRNQSGALKVQSPLRRQRDQVFRRYMYEPRRGRGMARPLEPVSHSDRRRSRPGSSIVEGSPDQNSDSPPASLEAGLCAMINTVTEFLNHMAAIIKTSSMMEVKAILDELEYFKALTAQEKLSLGEWLTDSEVRRRKFMFKGKDWQERFVKESREEWINFTCQD